MHNNNKSIAVAVMMAFTTGCVSTTESTAVDVAIDTPPSRVVHPQIAHAPKGDGTITLEQIMADPQWLGRQPTNAHWSVDGEVVYQQERENSKIKSLFSVSPNDYTTEQVPFSEYYLNEADELVSNLDGSLTAWRYQDSLFVKDAKGQIRQLTKGEVLKGIAFTTDNRLMGQVDDKIVVIDLDSGFREQLVSWSFAKAPTPVNKPKDYVAREQQALIQYIAKGRSQRTERFERDQALDKASPASASSPFYFDPSDQMIAIKASPAGDYAIAVTAPQAEYRDDSDIMPHYIQEDGRIAAKPVRQRVADATPRNHDVWLLNLKTGEKSQLSYHQLPGYNDDVLAEVKRENAAVHGDDYQVNRLPREITLLSSWYWSEPSIRWHKNGGQVALMLEAWDNKDRWITTVDFDRQQLVNQHRLHDDAWVNYRFNQFGWLSHSNTLFYQSEHSGYSHLYTQLLGEAPKAVTQGDYIVDDIHISADDQWVYYTANKAHPGLYEVYRSELSSGKQERLTELNGKTEFSLSPDETTLLLTHSKVNHPAELYLAAADGRNQTIKDVAQITDTVSDTFASFEWAIPQIVAIESSHTDQPIYARVYLPQDYQQGDARRAVVFNHGAGYLQNAHLGWSGYFREYMFHSMLVQQGYVVLDMDYRASAGYGRDWRTAIYRQMGTPEVQDLQDGVNWLVENANVDRNRIGTYGGSYGGFLTFMSMFTQPDLFQAGAALRPVTDWAHYNTPYTANILNTPDVDPIAYRRSSPIYFAEGLEKPLLINAPMVDDNVFFVDVVRLVQRLIELEKQDFETAIYPVEPHGFVQPSSWLDEYRRIYKLFEQHL